MTKRRNTLITQDHAFTVFPGQESPTPIDKGADFLLRAIEQGEMHAQPGQPSQSPGHGLAGGQLDHRRTVTDLSHRALIKVFERFGRLALDQTLDRFADVIAGLESSGTEAGQWFAGLAVGHHSDVADGKDARMVFHLKIGTDRNSPTMPQFHAERVDDRIGFQPSCPDQRVCLYRLPVR